MKLKSVLPLVVTSEIFFISTVSKNGLLMNSGLKVLPKGLKCIYLSGIMARMLMFLDGTGDVTYCADVRLFLHATSDRLSLTAAFSLR